MGSDLAEVAFRFKHPCRCPFQDHHGSASWRIELVLGLDEINRPISMPGRRMPRDSLLATRRVP
jgi:hypothetical protein